MNGNWSIEKQDDEAIKDFIDFVPKNICDIHAHIYRVKDLNLSEESFISQGPNEISISTWQKSIGQILGKAPRKALFIPFPTAKCDIDSANNYLVEQLVAFPESKGLIMVTPDYPKEVVTKYLKNTQIAGFKPYHVFSRSKPTFDSSIDAYVPEWVWELANEKKLVITLHIVKDKALSDEDNQKLIREKCIKYPDMKLILAHAARGFHAPNTKKGVKALRGLDNIWFDTSGICEAAPIKAILDEFGSTRLLWGSDFPVSQIRGKCVTVGDGFLWLDSNTVDWGKASPYCKPFLVGIESLRALFEAGNDFGLVEGDYENIFFKNSESILLN